MISEEAATVVGLCLAWISREIIPIYLKKANGATSANGKSNPPSSQHDHSHLATREDVARVELKVEHIGANMQELRDWMNQQIGEARTKK